MRGWNFFILFFMDNQNFQFFQDDSQIPPPQDSQSNQASKESDTAVKPKKSFWKFVFGFLGIILAVFVGYPVTKTIYDSYWADKAIKDYWKWEQEYKDALKNDTYGGKTPQETYEKFVETLKKGEILDAAKYYLRDEDRISAYKKFEKMQNEGNLTDWVAELPNWSEMKEVEYWSSTGKKFVYEKFREKEEIIDDLLMKGEKIILPAGKYQADIIFEINQSANIWKIYDL